MKQILLFTALILSVSLIYSQNADININGYINTDNSVPAFNGSDLLTTATWFTLPVSPHAVSRSCCAYIKKNDTGYVYQFGGGSGSQFNNVAKFNIVTNTWTNAVSTMPSQISAGYAISDGDSVIYVFGGNSPTLGKTLKWNIAANVWTTLTDMPTPATDMLCVKYQDTLVYAIVGGDGLFGSGVNNAVRLFKMRSATWTALTTFPVTKSMVGGGIYADTIIVTGGWTGSTGDPQTHKGVINPSNPTSITWTTLAPYPTGGVTRMASHVCLKPNQGVGIACSGGAISGGTLTNATNFWNFCTGAWQTLPANSQARSNLRGTGAGDSILYIIGGFTTVGVGTSERLTFSQIDGSCATVVGITTNQNGIPSGFVLAQNYPNPFNPTTTISFGVPVTGDVKIVLTDVLGREITVLLNSRMSAGVHGFDVDASNLSSGIYFYTMTAGDFKDTKKMLLVK
jgi:hypothetical protein